MRGTTVIKYAKQNAKLMAGIGLGLALGAVGTTAFVSAAIPDTDGKIYACYSSGMLARVRVIDRTTTNCNSNETAISWYQGGPGNFKEDLTNVDFTGASLQARDFPTANFTNSNFTSARLSGSDMPAANFTNTRMDGANLSKANASSANFTNSFFTNVTAIDANFQNADFTGAQLGYVNGGDFRNANFTNARLMQYADLGNANFTGINFTNINYSETENITFRDANLSGTNFRNLVFSSKYLVFFNTSLNNADFTGAQLMANKAMGQNISFGEGTTLSGTNFTNAVLKDVNIFADLSTAILTGVTWDNVYCPDGTNSNDNGNTCIGHLTYQP